MRERERTVVRIEELTQRHWSGQSAGSGGLGDGFHSLPWRDFNLRALTPEWSELARGAGTPNSFFEPWFLLPSLRHFDPDGSVHLAVLVSAGRVKALMPLWRDRDYHGHRLPHRSNWIHHNSFCGAPLIEPGFEHDFWRGVLASVDATASGSMLLQLQQLPVDGAAYAALIELCDASGRGSKIVHREQRALLEGDLPAEAYFVSAMSAKKRKELRRQRNRLGELGEVTVCRRRDGMKIQEWCDRFLALEKSGWKGAEGSAMVSDPRTDALFREALAGAAEAGRLERLELRVDERSIAMLVNFLAPPGAFAFKTAFDEQFARFSPGVLLQLENLALLDDPEISWCDSCAAAEHPMIERIWRDKREIAWVNVPIGGRMRRKVGAALSAIEALRAERRA